MRTEEIKIYTFDELSETAKENARDWYRQGFDYDWWDSLYEDAERAGLKLTSFDLDRNRHATGNFIWSTLETAHKIVEDHGEQCETYRTAKDYLVTRDELFKKYSDGTDQVTEDNEDEFDQECDELDAEFLQSLLEDYSILLQKEWEWMNEDEQVDEGIRENEYEFTKNGKRW